jgi:hypothetical protein
MADPYIDQFETLLYGKFAREQMEKVCLGRIKELDSAVKFAVAQQAQADADMKAVLDKQPQPASTEDASTTLEEARDTVVRFGWHCLTVRPCNLVKNSIRFSIFMQITTVNCS